MRNARLDELQAGIKIGGRNISNLRYVDNTTLMAESEDELKSFLTVKEESERAGLRLNIEKTKIMASGPIASWQIEGENVEVVTDFFFLGSQNTADSGCRHEIRRRLLLDRKVMTNLDSVLKSRDIVLPTKVHIVKATFFPEVMYGCECWTIKKENAKESMPLNCGAGEDSWKSLGQQGDQTSQSQGRSTLNIHWKDWCWSWSSSILIIWCKQMTHWRSPWCWERMRAGEEEGIREWDSWTASLVQWTWQTPGDGEDREAWCTAVHGVTESQTWLGNWTAATDFKKELPTWPTLLIYAFSHNLY